MTIITKPLSGEKKGDNSIVPLVEDDRSASAPLDDVEGQQDNPNILILRARARRVSSTTTLCLLIVSLLVVGTGIIGGKYLYDQYIRTQMRRFRGSAKVPISDLSFEETMQFRQQDPSFSVDKEDADLFRLFSESDSKYNDGNNNGYLDFSDLMKTHFSEDFEIDVQNESYEKIDVPDFRDGRSGRFIHDFNTNTTGIIDITGNRCFVMPLNRRNVLPPRSLFDLIHKMWDGYYKVDTQVVRETMRVITPPLDDLDTVGTYIRKECEGRPVYKLEKYVGGVVKRSADNHVDVKFAQFSGNKITQFDIINFEDVQEFEKENALKAH